MVFAEGVSAPEGPVALPDGTWLIVEGGAGRGCVTHLSADGRKRTEIRKTGRPNGLAVDAEGAVWVAESKTPSLLRLTLAGHAEVVATGCDGEPFLFPNDLCFGPDGMIYMTDSGVHIDEFVIGGSIRSDYMDVPYDGRVYRIDPSTGGAAKLDGGLKFTNGINFGPDRRLYVNETLTGDILRYAAKREVFGNVIRPDAPPGWKGPDGMAFDLEGRLYVAVYAQKDVTVLGPDGRVECRIETQGRLPTNVAFALPGNRRIGVTEYEIGQIETFATPCDGLPLWTGRVPA